MLMMLLMDEVEQSGRKTVGGEQQEEERRFGFGMHRSSRRYYCNHQRATNPKDTEAESAKPDATDAEAAALSEVTVGEDPKSDVVEAA